MEGISFIPRGNANGSNQNDKDSNVDHHEEALEEMAHKARKLERERKKQELMRMLRDDDERTDRKKHKKEKKEKKEKRDKNHKKHKHHKSEKRSFDEMERYHHARKDDATSMRQAAGLNWLDPASSMVRPGDYNTQQRKVEEHTQPSHIEEEIRMGLRDPVSKRPYGLYDPKRDALEKQLVSNPKPQIVLPDPATNRVSETTEEMDPNKLAAAAMKAKLKGDMNLYNALMERVQYTSSKSEGNPPRAKVKQETTSMSRKLPGANEEDLLYLKQMEKITPCMDKTFAKNLFKAGSLANTFQSSSRSGKDEADDSDMNKINQMYTSSSVVLSGGPQHSRNEESPLTRANKKDLVFVGENLFVSMCHTPLAAGHCIITPVYHCPSMVASERNVQEELFRYKKLLESTLNQSMIYLETVLENGACTKIDCIPLSEEQAEMVPMVFKTAFLEAGDEWDVQKNKLISTDRNRAIPIPPNFGYFHVEWGGGGYQGGGYAHTIQDQSKYPRRFLMDILKRGILDDDTTQKVDETLKDRLIQSFKTQ